MRNYLSEMLYALTSAYNRQDYDNRQRGLPLETNIGKLFSILAWGLDSIQEQTELIKLWEDLDNACGVVLDRYGTNFGVKRISSNDSYYRLSIKIKLISQLSGGDIDTVIHTTSSLLGIEDSDIVLEELFPARIALHINKKILAADHIKLIGFIALAVKRVSASGVALQLCLYSDLPPSGIYVGGMVAKRRAQRFGTIPAAKMKTYDDIRKIYGNFDELRKRTYDELLLYD